MAMLNLAEINGLLCKPVMQFGLAVLLRGNR